MLCFSLIEARLCEVCTGAQVIIKTRSKIVIFLHLISSHIYFKQVTFSLSLLSLVTLDMHFVYRINRTKSN